MLHETLDANSAPGNGYPPGGGGVVLAFNVPIACRFLADDPCHRINRTVRVHPGAGGGGGGGGGAAFKTPAFVRLRAEGLKRIAQFRTSLVNGASPIEIRGVAEVEGAGNEALPAGLQVPRVAGWVAPDGTRREGSTCQLNQAGDFLMEVEFGGDYAINVRCEPVEQ